MFHIINKDKMKFIIAGSFNCCNICSGTSTSSEPTESVCEIDPETGLEWCTLVPSKKTCKG